MSSSSLPWWLPLSVVVWAAQMVVFHGVGYLFEHWDRTGAMRRFKVRDQERKSYRELLPRVLFNQVFILLPAMVAVQYLGWAFTGSSALSLLSVIGILVVMGIGHDVVQYATHRYLLHQPALVPVLKHSIHHSTRASRGISACYMSGADFFLEIVLPYLVPLVVVGGGGSNVVFQSLIAGLGALGGVYEHSGYDFSILLPKTAIAKRMPQFVKTIGTLISSHAHGQHHTKGNVSFSDGFGSPGVCDRVFGTAWDQVEARKRAAAAGATTEEVGAA